MTAHEFLVSKGVKNMGAQFTAFNIEIWLEEYMGIVLKIAAEKAETTIEESSDNPYDHYIVVDKESILNYLK